MRYCISCRDEFQTPKERAEKKNHSAIREKIQMEKSQACILYSDEQTAVCSKTLNVHITFTNSSN